MELGKTVKTVESMAFLANLLVEELHRVGAAVDKNWIVLQIESFKRLQEDLENSIKNSLEEWEFKFVGESELDSRYGGWVSYEDRFDLGETYILTVDGNSVESVWEAMVEADKEIMYYREEFLEYCLMTNQGMGSWHSEHFQFEPNF